MFKFLRTKPNPIPCINCLTYPICKGLFTDNKDRYLKVMFIHLIQNKCSDIVLWLSNKNDKQFQMGIQEIISYYKEH